MDKRYRSQPFVAFTTGVLILAITLMSGSAWSSEEKITPNTRPVIRSASEIDYPPFCIIDKDGRATGFSVELMRAALNAVNYDVIFRTGLWENVKDWLAHETVQALPLVGRTPEREKSYDFTFPYMSLHGAIVVRKGTTDIRGLEDLKGRNVAVMAGDNAEEFLRREDRGIQITTTKTFIEALRELSKGQHDAVVVQRLVAMRLLQETGITNLQIINKPVEGFLQDFCFAVREKDRETLALLNEGLALVIADGTYNYLHVKWFASLELPTNRRIVIGGDDNYPPYEYLDGNGRPAGYNVDLTRAIAQEVGLSIEIRLGPWEKIKNALTLGEIDIIQGMSYSPERNLVFDFTPPHIVNNYVAVVRKGEGFPPANADELAGKRIVVQNGDIMQEFVIKHGFGDKVVAVESQESALQKLSKGNFDCALVARMTALYWIKKQGWNNLVVGNQSLLSPEYCYAVKKNNKVVLAPFTEGLKILETTGEYRRIYDKWMGGYKKEPLKFMAVLRYVGFAGIPFLLIFLTICLWTWLLRKKVMQRTADLRESQEKFRLLSENTADCIWQMSLDFQFIYINSAVESFFGYAPEEYIGSLLQEHCSIEDFQRIQTCLSNLLDSPSDISAKVFEANFNDKQGKAIPCSLSVTTIFDDRCHPSYFQGTMRDITERKKAEHKLLESREKLTQAVNGTPTPTLILDHNHNLTHWNTACEGLTGFSSSEMIGKKKYWCAFYTEERPILADLIINNASEEEINRLYQGKIRKSAIIDGAYEGEVFFPHLGGKGKWVYLAAAPLKNSANNFIGAIETFQDITDRKNTEEQLRQAQKMESVGRLAGGVAHDYNNALSVIIGFTELIVDDPELTDSIRDDLTEVLKAAKRATGITRQLLAFARKQTIAPKVLDLNEVIEAMLKMIRRLIGEDISLSWLPGVELWAVKVDPSQIDQVLANLCVNARDAIEDVGKITIETKNATFDKNYCADHHGFVPGEFVMLAVSDNGCGMNKETLNKIFEPFFTTKSPDKGTGLGLATVYGIMKQNNGFINVYSEPGSGTTIKLYFRRHEGDAIDLDTKNITVIPKGNGEVVLIAEDDPALLNLSQKILKDLGYTVLTAATVDTAIALGKEYADKIQILVTDVIMPGMNGLSLANTLQPFCPNMKRIFMSGYTSNAIAHHGVLDAGVHFIGSFEELIYPVNGVILTSHLGSEPERSTLLS